MASLKANIAQESAVNSIYGPVIIVSCPGSGKTTTLVRRINRMIEAGIDARSILMVTFTKSAAADMEKRYRQIYGEAPGVVFQTIHALCRNILVAERVIGEKSLLNEKESREILSGLLEGRPEIGNAIDMAETMLSEFGKYKESDISLEDYEPSGCEKSLFMEIADAYTSAKKEIGKVDFDDLLTGCRDLLRDNRKTLSKWQRRFQFIQCDEYQDTSRIQKDILYMLAGKKANLCVVGDDDQSIYRFRGADNHIMMQFEEDFRDRGVRKVLMNTNYRSAPEIVDMADVCIRNNRVRFEKEFISERGREGAKGTAEYKAYRTKAAEMEDIISVIRKRSKEPAKIQRESPIQRDGDTFPDEPPGKPAGTGALRGRHSILFDRERDDGLRRLDVYGYQGIYRAVHGDQYPAEPLPRPKPAKPIPSRSAVQGYRFRHRADDGRDQVQEGRRARMGLQERKGVDRRLVQYFRPRYDHRGHTHRGYS